MTTVKNSLESANNRPRLVVLLKQVAHYSAPWIDRLSQYFRVTVIVSSGELPEFDKDSASRHNLEVIQARTLTWTRVLGANGNVDDRQTINFDLNTLGLLRSVKPDVILSGEFGSRTLAALIYARISGAKLWVISEETPISGAKRSRIRKLFRRWGFGKVVPRWWATSSSAASYLRSLGVPSGKIVVVRPPILLDKYSPEGDKFALASQKPRVLFVGQLIGRKGIHQLLKSAVRLWDDNVHFSLVVVGSGPLRQALFDLIPTEYSDRVEFVGSVDPDKLASIYRACDAFVFPTLEDVWGHVVQEALSCGLPTMASCYAGSAIDLLHDECLFDPLVPEQIDEALRKAVFGEISLKLKRPLISHKEFAKSLAEAMLTEL